MIYIISYTPQGGEEFSVVVFAVFAIVLLFMYYQVVPIIVLLKWFYSEIAFNTKYFVKGIKNGWPCIVEIRGTQGCALVGDPARAVGECRDVAKAQP